MVLQYTVFDVELPNPGNFPYPGCLQGFLHALILGLPYPVKFPCTGLFPYPVKSLMLKSMYFLKAMIIRIQNC